MLVTLFVRVWIEIALEKAEKYSNHVTLFVRVWIEIYMWNG